MPWSPPPWDSSPVNRVNPSGGRVAHSKHAKPAWQENAASPPDLHREHGIANKKFASGLRDWEPLPARPVSARNRRAHTERGKEGGSRPSTQLFADALKLPAWQSSNKKKPSLLYQPKFGRKGVEANL